jgi:transposase
MDGKLKSLDQGIPKPQQKLNRFLKNLSKKIMVATKRNSNKKIRIFFQDEGRFGRISQLKKSWSAKGKRLVVPAQHIRQYTYTFAAIEPKSGETVSLILPEVNGETMSLFLAEVAARNPEDYLLMVLDGAAWHKSKALVVPHNMKLIFLPPYSPELNPVEQLWKAMRGKWFANKLFNTMDALEDNLVQALRWVESSNDWVKSFSLYNWINYAIPI